MSENCDLDPGETLPQSAGETVFYRVIRTDIRKSIRVQINEYLNDRSTLLKKEDIEVQQRLFPPRRLTEDGSSERGKSIDWTACIAAEESISNQTTEYPDSYFGLLEIRVDDIQLTTFLSRNLYCEYDPIPKNLAHSLIINYGTMQEEIDHNLKFMELRQRMSEIATWHTFPEFS